MQEPISDIACKIMERTKTRIEISHNRVLNTSTYLISGKPDNVAKAKREVCSKLSPRITKIVQVPAFVRAQVVGVRGKTLQKIQTQTGTSITITRASASVTKDPNEDDLFDLIDISIIGDNMGVLSAIAQIEAITNKRTTKRAVQLTDIPREAYALLVGKNGETLNVFQLAHPQIQIRIPSPIAADQTICIAGEREEVNAAAADLRSAAHTLMENSQVVKVSIPKRQHRFIIGENGQTLIDIINATGCSVLVPPPRSPSDQVTVRGPESSLVQTLGLVMTKANSAILETVDPTTVHQYGRPLLYAQRALQYFHDRDRFRRIESEHGVTLRVPSAADAAAASAPEQVQIELQGKDSRSVAAAREALVALFGAFPPYHFNSIEVEPHLHALLSGRDGANAARLQAARSVYALFPGDSISRNILVVYEGFNPDIDRVADAAGRERATRELLRKTLEEFRTTIQNDDSYVTHVAKVPAKLQQSLAKASALDGLLRAAGAADADNRVVVRFGGVLAGQNEPESTRTTRKGDAELDEDEVEVKGLASAVDNVIVELSKRVKADEEYVRLHSFRGEVTVPQQLMPRIIGRGGENIKRIRSERDVAIDIADGTSSGAPGVVKLQGTREDVAAVIVQLEEFVERMADQTSEIVSVPANIHKALIGVGGRYVKRLEDKYAVRVQFPSSKREASDEEQGSAPALNPDQIRIRGGQKGVEGAKSELLELAAYEVEHSHTARFKVPAASLPHIVGKSGTHINEIKDESETKIELGTPNNGEVEVTIVGTRAGVKLAREAIEAVVAEQKSQIDVMLSIPVKHHRFLIGSGGNRVRELVQQAGGNPDAMSGSDACRVQFPRASENTDDVRLKGDRAIVEAVRKSIEELVAERERMTTTTVQIPVSQHAFIIGRGGSQLKQLQDTHSVEIHFRSKSSRVQTDATGDRAEDPSTVRITGLPENCESCKSALLALVRDETRMAVPLALHQRLGGRGGSLWRRVRSEFDVQVDAAHVDKIPARRIDEKGDMDNATEDIVYRDAESSLSELKAEWILRGEKAKLSKAVDLINNEISKAGTTVEAHVRIESRLHRFVIGKQGANIAKIRDTTGCEVNVPKRDSSSQWIVITGGRTGADRAIEMIHEYIEERD
ncbi:hypothetical protein BX070DRAFT_192766 [Coemansia spiralis]|nr:hypothetical protein BX070DRAFT_192766 [Coemansia spiralis]